MANFNRLTILGNLTAEPQLSYLPSGTSVTELRMAVNRKFKKQDGQTGEECLYLDCRAMGKTAELLAQYLHKGHSVLLDGRLQLDQWTDKQGEKRSKHRMFIESFQFLQSPQQGSTAPQAAGYQSKTQPPQPRPVAAPQQAQATLDSVGEDEIPF